MVALSRVPNKTITGKRRVLADLGFSLKQSMLGLLPSFAGEFNQPMVYKMLRERYPEVAEHIQKASVSATLQVLVKDGYIRETYAGFGSEPKRYVSESMRNTPQALAFGN